MVADRMNYVMSVDIAMSREMAHRNQLQALGTSSRKDPLHFQVPTPASSQGLRTAPESTPNSFLHSTTGFIPTGSVQLARPPPSLRTQSSFNTVWRPNLSTGNSPLSVSQPIQSHINSVDRKRKGPVNIDHPVKLGSFFCLTCQKDCTTSYNLMMHYQGQKHRAMVVSPTYPTKKKVASGSGLSKALERIYCKFCGIWCKDEYTFRLHLQCKNHNLKLQFEKKMKKPMS